jgi:hypothetical protein
MRRNFNEKCSSRLLPLLVQFYKIEMHVFTEKDLINFKIISDFHFTFLTERVKRPNLKCLREH